MAYLWYCICRLLMFWYWKAVLKILDCNVYLGSHIFCRILKCMVGQDQISESISLNNCIYFNPSEYHLKQKVNDTWYWTWQYYLQTRGYYLLYCVSFDFARFTIRKYLLLIEHLMKPEASASIAVNFFCLPSSLSHAMIFPYNWADFRFDPEGIASNWLIGNVPYE